jgi:hypothetical protein
LINSNNLISNIEYFDNYKVLISQILFLNSKKQLNTNIIQRHYLSNLNNKYYTNNKIANKTQIFTNSITTSDFNNLTFYNQYIFNNNLSNNLNYSKQQRWLWRNNILSDKIITKCTSWTSLKKLLGNPIWDIDSIQKNIWFSNKALKMPNFKKINQLNTMNQVGFSSLNYFFKMNNNLLNFENFENSLLWTSKRYKVFQSLGTNQQKLFFDKPYIDTTSEQVSISTNNYTYFVNWITSDYNFSKLGLTHNYNYVIRDNDPIYLLRNKIILSNTNVDLLTSSDSEFLTATTSNHILKGSKTYFFSNI